MTKEEISAVQKAITDGIFAALEGVFLHEDEDPKVRMANAKVKVGIKIRAALGGLRPQ